MAHMFFGARAFNGDLSKWDVSKVCCPCLPFTSPPFPQVTNMSSMFDGAAAFNGDLSTWDVSKVFFVLVCFSQAPPSRR